jgi:hypothetical protein
MIFFLHKWQKNWGKLKKGFSVVVCVRVSRGFADGSDRKAQEARISSYKIMQNNNNMKTCTPLNTYEFLYHISKLSNVVMWRGKMRHWKGKEGKSGSEVESTQHDILICWFGIFFVLKVTYGAYGFFVNQRDEEGAKLERIGWRTSELILVEPSKPKENWLDCRNFGRATMNSKELLIPNEAFW